MDSYPTLPQPKKPNFWQIFLSWPWVLKVGLGALILILVAGALWLYQTPQNSDPTLPAAPQQPSFTPNQPSTAPEDSPSSPEVTTPNNIAQPGAPAPTQHQSGSTILGNNVGNTAPPASGGGNTVPPPSSTRPNASNTGPAAGTIFITYTGPAENNDSNVTYENYYFPEVSADPFYYKFYGDNVVLRNCKLDDGVTFYGDNIRLENCIIKGGVSLSGTAGAVINRNNLFDYDDGLHLTSDSGQVSNVAITNNYLHHPGAICGSHTDGIQLRGGDGITITDNTIDIGPEQIVCGEGIVNAAIYLEDDNGGNRNVTIESNFLNGGGYILRLQHTTNLRILDNRFGSDFLFDYVNNLTDPGDITQLSGNVVDATGASVDF